MALRYLSAAVFAMAFLQPAFAGTPTDSEIEALLRQHVEDRAAGTGVVAGIIDSRGRRVYAHGHASLAADSAAVDADSLFEIGSITKVFTALLLADMIERSEVTLATTVGELLPEPYRDVPAEIASITLRELATHTSGLPRLPLTNRSLVRLLLNFDDPYNGTKVSDDVFAPLADMQVQQRGKFAYSNFGAALLGHLLAEHAGKPYGELLRERLLQRWQLDDTWLSHEHAPAERLVTGFRGNRRPTSHWTLDAFTPAGSLVSSVDDLLDFLALQLDSDDAVMRLARLQHAEVPAGSGMSLGWIRERIDAGNGETLLLWHNGGTGGFRSFIGFLPEENRAVALLTNSSVSPDALARQLLGADIAIPARETNIAWLLISLVGLSLPPLAAGFMLWRFSWHFSRRSSSHSRRPESSKPKRQESRIAFLLGLAALAFLYAVFLPFGPWQVLPYGVGLASAGLTILLLLACLPHARKLSWRGDMSVVKSVFLLLSALVYLLVAGLFLL